MNRATGIPLVLHGGSGVNRQCLLDAIGSGIAKINVGTEMRQEYEFAMEKSNGDVLYAQEQLYLRAREYIHSYLGNENLNNAL